MKKYNRKERKLSYRMLYIMCYALLYPFALVANVGSRIWGQRFSSDIPSTRFVFNETSAQLNAALPWIYYV